MTPEPESILSRFRALRPSGAGWTARCPAHDDQSASLSISRGDRQPWVLRCHAGCDTERIVEAAGLKMADILEPRTIDSQSTREIVATYDYHDEHGALLYQVVRMVPKDFRQRRPDGNGGWTWRLGNVRRVLYRLRELQGQAVVHIVEGEKDADRLWSLGVAATTNASGAGKWRAEYAQQLRAAGVQSVVILPDNDDPGRAHAAAVAASCADADAHVKVISLPGVPLHGDVSDWLGTGHTLDELQALVAAAPLYARAAADDRVDLITLSDVMPEAINWIWLRRLARGKYTLLAGDPGGGKSTAGLDIAARLSRGSAWPDGGMAPQGRTLLLSAEDGISDVIRPRLDLLDADASQIVVLNAVRDESGSRPFNLARDLDRLALAVARVKPILVIIDPISAYLGRTDAHRDSEVRGLLAPLTALLEREGAALLAIAHLSKDAQRAALHRPGGSIAFVAAARIALCLAADPNDPDRRVLASLKNNLAPAPNSLAFRLPNGRLTWEDGAADLNAEALLRPTTPGEHEDQTDAEKVIGALLDDEAAWPLEAKHALEAGKAHGIHERTLRRTARRLGIRIARMGFGGSGKWLWHRPDIADSDRPDEYPEDRGVSAMAAMQEPPKKPLNNNIEDKKSAFTRARERAPEDADVIR